MGQKFGPASRKRRTAPPQRWPRCLARRLLAASAAMGPGSSGPNTRSIPMRRLDRTLSVAGAVGGATWAPAVGPQLPGAPSARGATPSKTTGAPLRDARLEGAAHAFMGRPSAPTVEDPMGRGQMPALPGGRSAGLPGAGGHRPHRGGRGGLPRCPRLQRMRSRPPKRGWRARRRSRWGKRKDRVRLLWSWGSRRLEGSVFFESV